MLKEQLDVSSRQRDDTQRKLDAYEAEIKQYRAEKQAEQDAYSKAQEPKYSAYVQDLEASRKEKLSEPQREGYRQTFCDMRFKAAAKDLEMQLNEKVELRASLKAALDKASVEEEHRKTLETSVTKTTAILNNSRADFAKTIDNGQASSEDEQRRKVKADVEASANLGLNQMMCAPASIAELPFAQAYGYRSEVDVNASATDPYGGGRLFRKTMPVAASHKHLIDEDGNSNFPASARIHNKYFFSWMCDNDFLREGNLNDLVVLNASKNTVIRKDAGAWYEKNQASGKTTGITAD